MCRKCVERPLLCIRTAFAVYKLHNLTKILLMAHITQLNFSRSNFYSNGEI